MLTSRQEAALAPKARSEDMPKTTEKGIEISLIGMYLDLQVPLTLWIDKTDIQKKKAKEKNRLLFMDEKKKYSYFSYSRETLLAEELFEIMRKLELISDMGCYDRVNEILKHHTISGRYIMEDLKIMGQKEPKVVTMKRLHPGSISGWGRTPGKGNGYPLQCSHLESSMDRGAWWATVHGVAKN